ncbi:peptide-methionine (S)-S-oxide reductase MsrA [Pseudobacillus badius]|uniref:peptide-methionine (S)-S-oxide reductase MsrA n=1 Tax=Bacillus badius TaxID=1455 RepID=UPI0007B06712|nr:peptide-methionine (S)-S-oxide reductase MsrA [Bacillus badius]KZN99706.1 peptide-methionine (S)-S-oxide reductase [Bacillus badius]MED0666493.1 peptide-methionine (S)-S-oxide reductase MsrA [Bacillus badius]OCS85810.1 peptide-methionine (S)-S-oxide reductase [Bacillus badius]OVE51832.1 peptide-methionine (S)-S-oxide reductase [Bacillus badius]TDW03258.1 peptide-methionine (S)-S-oxide reductase [Bacillus badius]
MDKKLEKATFAGGCFWCMVKPFDQWDGVHAVISGYTGGKVPNPTYEQVKSGATGHLEAVEITYDPSLISYETILDLYWPQIDPTDDGGQFHDRGDSYRTAIFYHTTEQKELAEASKKKIGASGKFQKPIVTRILPAAPFYPAEDDHQDFYKKNPEEYQADRRKSGRDEFIKEHWTEDSKH